VNERRTVVGGGVDWPLCVPPQPWREIDAHAYDNRHTRMNRTVTYSMNASTPTPQMSAATPTFSLATFSGAGNNTSINQSINQAGLLH